MGEELSLARKEEEGQSMLLAYTSSGERITTSYVGDERKEKSATPKVSHGRKIKDIETESKGSSEVEGTNASPFEKEGRGRDNQDRESDRGDERKYKRARRSAQELGITFPGSFCNKAETIPHYWVEVDRFNGGSLFQCKYCLDYVWLPSYHYEAERMSILMKQFGKDEGYCRYLNRHRGVKLQMAKLQELTRLEAKITDKREFARMADKILSDREYDRKEVNNVRDKGFDAGIFGYGVIL